jgi:uncharacterized protein (DUF2147 family)
MRSKMTKRFMVMLAMLLAATFALAGAKSPIGYWKQISDNDGKLHSIVKVYRSHGVLKGKVVRGFRINGRLPQQYCSKCPGHFKNKKILGLVFLWGFKYNKNSGWWEGGHILDPNSGDMYKCKMALTKNGTRLHVRGYIGISLFGRTQTWLWIPPSKVKAELAKGLKY